MATGAICTFDSEAAALVKETFGYFFEAFGNLPEVRVYYVAPFFHTFGNEPWEHVVSDFVVFRHPTGIANVDYRGGRAIVPWFVVIEKIDGNSKLIPKCKSDVNIHDNGLIFIGTHHMAVCIKSFAYMFSHFDRGVPNARPYLGEMYMTHLGRDVRRYYCMNPTRGRERTG